jgi:glutamate-1-semialdehyde 2,1-aminomutase
VTSKTSKPKPARRVVSVKAASLRAAARGKSAKLFERARAVIPGGVNSPVRAFKAVGGSPRFIASAKGATITDVDGVTYIDYVMSWGPLIHGHAPGPLVAQLGKVARLGTSYGAPTELEVQIAEKVRSLMPSIEMVRFTSSGTEATMSAVRVARAATGRDRLIKFAGCYHGHADGFLVEAGSGALTLGVPTSPGVAASTAALTLTATFNDLDSVAALFEANTAQVAAVVVEPIVGNMGTVPPAPGFLKGLRTLCDQHGAILIFDEVMTGFRVHRGGAQALYGVWPDLTCLGKIVGGGLPVGAYGGRKDLMSLVAPAGPMYQAGTLSGNPLAVTAGLWSIERLTATLYRTLERLTKRLADGLLDAAGKARVPLQVNRVGSMITPFFTATPVTDYATATKSDTERFGRFHRGMLARGIYLPASQYEAWFLSAAHTERHVDRTIAAARAAFAELDG